MLSVDRRASQKSQILTGIANIGVASQGKPVLDARKDLETVTSLYFD